MTIVLSANTPRVSYTVNQGATQTAFTVNFEFFDDADLNFYVDGTKKTLSTHYTVSGGNGSTGTINTTSGNTVTGASGGSTIVITRDIALARITDFPSSGSFQVATLNTELDRFTAIASDISDETTRSIQLADEDSAVSMVLPLLASRKGTVLGFNASTGAVEAGPTITAVQSLSAVTASINLLGTSAVVEDMGLLATSAVIEDMGLLATSGNITAMGLLGVSGVITDMGILGTTAIVEDMGFLGTSANVTAMGHLGTSANVTAMGKLGNDATVADMAILGTDAIVADMAILANSTIVDDLAILATSAIVDDMALLATSAVIEDMGLLATSAVIEDMGLLATSAVIEDMGLLATSAVIEDMGLLGVAGVIEDMGILGTSANVTAMSNVSGAIGNVNTVATNIGSVNNFALRYIVASSAPSSGLDEGDLYYDTSTNSLNYYNGSAWIAVVAGAMTSLATDSTPQLGGNLDVQTNSIVSTSNRNIAITPNGSGKVVLDGLSHPTSDGSAGQFLKTDGSGNLSFATVSTTTAFDDVTAGDAAVNVTTTSGNITIDAQGSDTDIIFKGTDGSSDITPLTLDMSDAGKAIFTGDVQVPSINGSQIAVTNLIINGDMAVNQRGATSGVTSGFFVDRFSLSGCSASAVITSSTPTQFPKAITVSATSGNPIVTQKIESKNLQHLSGKVVTVSFFAKNVSNATTLFVSLQYAGGVDNWSSSTTISEQNLGNLTSDWVKYTASWTVPSGGLNGLQLNILCSGTSTFTMGVTGVQLEEGSVATPFQFKKFADQMSDCQRYYVRAGGTNYANIFGTGGIANTTGSWFGFGTIPVPMRTAFTLQLSGGTPRIQNGQAGFNASSVAASLIASDSKPNIVISMGCNASSLTLYRWHNMDAGASAALFELDAEL